MDRDQFERARAKYWRRCQLWANARRRLGVAFFANLAAVEAQIASQLEAEFPPPERADLVRRTPPGAGEFSFPRRGPNHQMDT